MPSRQDRRKVSVGSISFLILMRASKTIGPRGLASVLAHLIGKAGRREHLPQILNVASAQPVFMADLLVAAGFPFSFITPDAHAIERVGLSTSRLAGLVPVHSTTPKEMIADWRGLMAAAT